MTIITEWLAGKVSGIVIFCLACLAPVLLVCWVWEAVELHGIGFDGPFGIHVVLAHGAILDRDNAVKDRDKAVAAQAMAEHDRDTWKKNAGTLSAGLDRCNASVTSLAAAGRQLQDAAQKLVDQRLTEARVFQSRMDAVNQIKATDEKCPVVDKIFSTGFGP